MTPISCLPSNLLLFFSTYSISSPKVMMHNLVIYDDIWWNNSLFHWLRWLFTCRAIVSYRQCTDYCTFTVPIRSVIRFFPFQWIPTLIEQRLHGTKPVSDLQGCLMIDTSFATMAFLTEIVLLMFIAHLWISETGNMRKQLATRAWFTVFEKQEEKDKLIRLEVRSRCKKKNIYYCLLLARWFQTLRI